MHTLSSASHSPSADSLKSPSVTRIALVSDTHTNFSSEGDASRYRERFVKIIADVNGSLVDAVVVSGDVSENGTDEEFTEFQQQSKAFLPPVWVVPGNHDIGGKHLPNAPGQTTRERIRLFEARFGSSFWQAEVAGVRLLGLNSLLMGSGFDREREQWTFLEQALDSPTSLPTIVVLHQPLFLESIDEPGGDYWNIEPAPRSRLLDLFRRAGVRAVLSGHIHRPLSLREYGIAFITTPPVSFGLPFGEQPEGWTLVSVPSEIESTVTAEIHYFQDDLPLLSH